MTLNQPLTYNALSHLRAAVEVYKARRSHRAAYQAAYAKLQRISDAELTEFGLYRSDLSDMAWAEAAKS